MRNLITSFVTGSLLVMAIFAFLWVLAIGMPAVAQESPAEAAGYVGSEKCSLCHSDIASKWVETPHANYVREPNAETVVADFTQPAVISGRGVPVVTVELGVVDGVYTAKVGDTVYPIAFAFGGLKWKQRYLTKIGNSLYILPIQWNMATQEWVAYHPDDWYDTTGTAIEIGKTRSWDRRCSGCHTTGNMPTVTEEGEFIANFIEDSIGCEACHGPGAEHASTGNAALIVNPAKIEDFDRKNDVCGSCHIRGTSNGGTYGYPYDEVAGRNFRPGDDLETMFIDGGGDWPDGTSKKHHQQWLDWKNSKHEDNPYNRVSCIDCHDVHGTSLPSNLRDDPTVNAACLSCHGAYGFEDDAAITRHTNHPVDPAGSGASNCVECHMPRVAKSAVPYDIRSHTFEFISPEQGIRDGMPDSCTNCHDGVTAVAMSQPQAVVEFGTSFCTSCHSESTEQKEWLTSKHAVSLSAIQGKSYAGDRCLPCHSVDYILAPEDAKPTIETAQGSLSCAACHSHEAENEHNLVKPIAEICVDCHTMGEAEPGKSPHHPQIEMIAGIGAAIVPDEEGGHSKANPELCVTCHMFREESEALQTEGGHTFSPSMDACVECHADPQAIMEQVQAEITLLLDDLATVLDGIEDKESEAYLNAKFNRDVVSSDGSHGVHNYQYAKAMMVASYDALGVPLPTAGEEPEIGQFTISLAEGLNMMSLPLMPDVPYTARSLSEKLGATIVIKLDTGMTRFVGFTPTHDGDGFDIKGGAGYIVNVPAAVDVTFEGKMWTNAVNAAPSAASTGAWAFIMTGFVHDTSYEAASSGEYTAMVRNLRTGAAASDMVGISGDGRFTVVWADLSRKSVVEAGDSVEITIRDSAGQIVSGPAVHQVTADDIERAFGANMMELGDIVPEKSVLAQNYPNPFNPETWIPYQLAEDSDVAIRIYSVSGKLVRVLNLNQKNAGTYMSKQKAAYWNGRDDNGELVASGVYVYSIQAGTFTAVRKMVILK